MTNFRNRPTYNGEALMALVDIVLSDNSFNGATLISEYPEGYSSMSVDLSSSGWPTSGPYSIITYRIAPYQGFQWAQNQGTGALFYRSVTSAALPGVGAWTTWIPFSQLVQFDSSDPDATIPKHISDAQFTDLHNQIDAAGAPDPRYAPEFFDDFIFGSLASGAIGQYGWILGGGGTLSRGNSDPDAPGIYRRTGLASAGNIVSMELPNTIHTTMLFDMRFRVKAINFDPVNTGFRFGVVDMTTVAPAHGAYVQHLPGAAGAFFGQARNGSGSPNPTSIGTMISNTWHVFRVRRIDASTIGFSMDGGTEVTKTTNLPAFSLAPVLQMTANNAVSRVFDVDYFHMKLGPVR